MVFRGAVTQLGAFLFPAVRFSVLAFVMHKTINRSLCSAGGKPVAIKSSVAILSATTPAEKVEGVLQYVVDRYDGVVIDSATLPSEVDEFSATLTASLVYWKSISRRGVWLKVPIEKVDFIAPAVKAGFVFHHAEKGYVMLNHWLSEEENRMPPNASHQVGVGSIVVHDGKLLLVKERSGPLRGLDIWKVPTGLSDQGEDISDAAMREVHEETGIETEFVSVLAFRQNHGALFGKSDLYFVCLLRPKTTTIHTQTSELEDCQWVDPEVYFKQDLFRKSGVYAKLNLLMQDAVEAEIQYQSNNPDDFPTASTATAVQGNESGVGAGAGKDHAHKEIAPQSIGSDSSNNSNNSNGMSVGIPIGRQFPLAPLSNDEKTPPISSLVASKLPIGFRPGHNTLYHFPMVRTTAATFSDTGTGNHMSNFKFRKHP